MTRFGRVRGAAAGVAVVALTVACTPDAAPRPGQGSPPESATPRESDPPVKEGPPPTPTPTARCEHPLVIATHQTRQPLRLSEEQARRLTDGAGGRRTVDSVAALVADPGALAVLPARRVGPRVRVAIVDGVHPLRRPAAYPIQVPADRCPPKPTTMTVVGDVMLGRRVAEAAGDQPGRQLRATAPRLRAADVTVGNLESTLSSAGAPTQGGDSFSVDPRAAGELVRAGFDVLSLANNHAGDFGPLALRQTVRRLERPGLGTFGAGSDLAAAREPSIVSRRGTNFGFVGFNAIGETPEAGPGRTGALSVSMPPRTGPLDRRELNRFLRDVRRVARRVDVVIAMPHWGTQYTNFPEPIQRQVARELADAGADLVVGGHPHWVQGASTVGDTLVVHSLGNFVFDMDFMAETMVGVVLETVWWGDRLKAAELVPYRMDASFTPRFVSWREGLPTLRLLWETSGPAFSP